MSEENKIEEVKVTPSRRAATPVAEVKAKAVEEVKPVVEETKVEEVKPVVETKVEEVKPVVVAAPVAKEKTAKEVFEEAISKTPYTVFQNGVLVFTYNAYHDIKLTEKYFEINFKKYSYTGIEVKHG